MPSASWLNKWLTGDVVTAAEMNKAVGSVYSSTLGAPAANIDITTLPTYGAALLIIASFLSDNAAVQGVNIALNNDTTAANYSRGFVSHSGATPNSGVANDRVCGLNAHPTTNVAMSTGFLLLPGYLGNQKKGWFAGVAYRDTATQTTVQVTGGHWIAAGATATITRITLTPAAGNFNTGTRIGVFVMGE